MICHTLDRQPTPADGVHLQAVILSDGNVDADIFTLVLNGNTPKVTAELVRRHPLLALRVKPSGAAGDLNKEEQAARTGQVVAGFTRLAVWATMPQAWAMGVDAGGVDYRRGNSN
ncbi:MAG: hypothetical protein IPM60_14290 [Rhodospirillales bacterium]|nr:hypothetical protein [Rhodospirillales bacterium]